MSRYFGGCLSLLIAVIIILPMLLVYGCQPPKPLIPLAPGKKETLIKLYDVRQKKLLKLPLEEYLKGVVAAEMPAEFNLEALKSQAVIARTFAVKRMKQFGGAGCKEYPQADVSNDILSGQAWESKKELKKKWGLMGYLRYWKKVSQAVEETKGQVVTYQGQLIDAVYHSTCGGHTESSEDVWGNVVPYLRGKVCSYDTGSPRFHDTLTMSIKEMAEKLGIDYKKIGEKAEGVRVLERTESGRIKTILLGDKVFKGTDVRLKLGLRSTNFTWSAAGGQITFKTTGNGHGVGLCQYGANGLAAQGLSYDKIIKYYYTGVDISKVPSP